MLSWMSLRLVLVILVTAACSPAATTPTAAPSASATVTSSPVTSAVPSVTPSATPSRTPIPLPTGAQLAAAGNGVVWVFVNGDHLYRSSDRGDTWTERTLPQPIVPNGRIAFVSASDGWLLSTGSPQTQCTGQSVTLWRTTDGAASWTRLDPSGIAATQCKDSIAFRDAQRGYIGAWDPNTPPRIYRTDDGGKSWSSSVLPNPPAQRPDAFGDFGVAVFTDAQSGGANRYYAFRSADGGATWSSVSTGPIEGMPIVFVTATRWLQIFLPNQSQETTDTGSTWHAFTTDYSQAAPVAPQIVFGDANTGYATVRGGVQRTTDGGAHWTPLKTPGT